MAEPPTATRRQAAPQRQDALSAETSTRVSILALARLAAAGDERSISLLYEARFDHIFQIARRATRRDEGFCLDVVQETFLRIMRSGRLALRLRDDEHADRWLAAIARTVALDLLRAEQRRTRRELSVSRPESTTPTAGDTAAAITAIQQGLLSLPPEDRELLHLRASGMTLSAIAEFIGASLGSVHGRLRRLSRALASTQDDQHE